MKKDTVHVLEKKRSTTLTWQSYLAAVVIFTLASQRSGGRKWYVSNPVTLCVSFHFTLPPISLSAITRAH